MKRSGGVFTCLFWLVCGVTMALAGSPDIYRQRWHHPQIEARIAANIEKYRMDDITIEVVDAAGHPVPGAVVDVEQTGHAFLFGCNAFVLGQLASPGLNARYEQLFTNLFNFATVPFYWEGTEPAEGELRYREPARDIWRRPPPERYIGWAASHHITLKGHPLLWHAYNPAWLPKDPDALRGKYRKRFREIAEGFGSRIPIWDVVNESLVCPTNYPLYTKDRAYVGWAFKEALPLFPADRTMMINEVTSFNFMPAADRYYDQIAALQAQGAGIRGIGFQYHYFRRASLDGLLPSPQCDPAKLLDAYEKFGSFNLPLFITEITIPSAGEGGAELQEEIVRDHYRLWFAAPRMAGITWWNLGDGTAVKGENEAQGGLVDADFNPKPAYRALDQLINREWKTRTMVTTDEQGRATFRGFFGSYRVDVPAGSGVRRFTFDHQKTTPAPHRFSVVP